jgi:hypothetical protein
MRGNISPAVAKILADPAAEEQLRGLLMTGTSGPVVVGGRQYRVEVGPPVSDSVSADHGGARVRDPAGATATYRVDLGVWSARVRP